MRVAAWRSPQGQHADCIYSAATRRQQTFMIKFVDVFRVRRQENIERRRILDLGSQLRGGSHAEDRMDFGLRFEFRAERLNYFGQVGGGRDRDFSRRRSSELAGSSPKRYDDQ